MSGRLAPSISPDTQFFWDGLREHRLLVQRCTDCGRLRHPPRPMCPGCQSLAWDALESSGRGVVHSFVIPRHPEYPFMEHPYVVAVVELDEGTRIVSNIVDIAPEEITIDLPVEVTYLEIDGGIVLHQFRPAAQP